jgi:predicted nucleic acid-binding protein
MILVDTAPLVAAAIEDDDNHDRCVDVFNQMQQSGRSLLIPSFVAHEACFMLKRDGGARVAARFMRSLAAGGAFRAVELDDGDMRRVAELLVVYEDLGLDAADAAVIAIAERLRLDTVITLDYRDFRVVRPRHIDAFTLLPPEASA